MSIPCKPQSNGLYLTSDFMTFQLGVATGRVDSWKYCTYDYSRLSLVFRIIECKTFCLFISPPAMKFSLKKPNLTISFRFKIPIASPHCSPHLSARPAAPMRRLTKYSLAFDKVGSALTHYSTKYRDSNLLSRGPALR